MNAERSTEYNARERELRERVKNKQQCIVVLMLSHTYRVEASRQIGEEMIACCGVHRTPQRVINTTKGAVALKDHCLADLAEWHLFHIDLQRASHVSVSLTRIHSDRVVLEGATCLHGLQSTLKNSGIKDELHQVLHLGQ